MVHLEDAENLAEAGEYYSANKETLLRKFGIPIHHLDFAYVEKCKDGKELEKILQVLRSGEEGYFPDLMLQTERRIVEVKPNSKYIRKLTPVLTKSAIDKDELKEISDDFDHWLEIIKKNNEELEQNKNVSFGMKDVPEVRKVQENKFNAAQTVAKRIPSTDYESWDKFDAETEMLKMDLEDEKLRKEAERGEKLKSKQVKTVKFNTFSTQTESVFEANCEKEKGNECFKAGEYEDALEHYTNSIKCFPSASLFTNRAITYIKLKKYEKAISDCEEAFKYEPKNLKAALRMAQSYQALNKPNEALYYAENVVKIDPNNTVAQQIAEKARGSCGQNISGNVRFKIVDVDSTNSNQKVQDAKTNPKKPILKKSKSSNYEIIPIPGTSKMSSPYFKTVSSNDPVAVNNERQAINNRPQPLFLTSIDITSDDDNECTVNHTEMLCRYKEASHQHGDAKSLHYDQKNDQHKNVIVDNRNNPKVKGRQTHDTNAIFEEATEKNKCSKRTNIKSKFKKVNNIIKNETTDKKTEQTVITRDAPVVHTEKMEDIYSASSTQKETVEVSAGKLKEVVQEKPEDHANIMVLGTTERGSNDNFQCKETIPQNERGSESELRIIYQENNGYAGDGNNANVQIRQQNPENDSRSTNMRNVARVEAEVTRGDDIRGGGEPHVEERTCEVDLTEIHLPYTFIKTWQSVRRDGTYSGFASVIRSLNMNRITEVIGNKIDARILSDIINCLYRHFTVASEVEKVYNALSNLWRVQRFSIVIMFLSQNDKRLIQNLFEFLKQHDRELPNDIKAHYGFKL